MPVGTWPPLAAMESTGPGGLAVQPDQQPRLAKDRLIHERVHRLATGRLEVTAYRPERSTS